MLSGIYISTTISPIKSKLYITLNKGSGSKPYPP